MKLTTTQQHPFLSAGTAGWCQQLVAPGPVGGLFSHLPAGTQEASTVQLLKARTHVS